MTSNNFTTTNISNGGGCMEQLSILIWIKVYYNQTIFAVLGFSNFTIFDHKLIF